MNIKEQSQDRVLFISVITLISFGLFMLFSASWVKSLEITGGNSRTYFLVSQMIKLIPAFFIFILLISQIAKQSALLTLTDSWPNSLINTELSVITPSKS